MAKFPWQKKDDGSGGKSGENGSPGGVNGPLNFDGTKAAKFFEKAQTLHEATSFGYAMNMWIRGMRFDPMSMIALEGFFKSAGSFFSENPKGEKEDNFKSTLKDAAGKTDVDKYLTALVQWSSHPHEPAYAVKAMELAASLGLEAPALWIADRAAGAVLNHKKPRKEHLVAAMQVYQKFDKFEKAVQVGEAAIRIDPADARLSSDVKNLAAEWTTKRGGFDQMGEEGGFRSNVRDMAKARQMEDQNRLVTTEDAMDRQVATAKADVGANPNDRPNAMRLIDVLLKRGKPEDEEEALVVAGQWHEKTKEYRFREYVDTIHVRQLRRRAASLRMQSDRPDATEETKEAYRAALREFVKAEILALQGQVTAYPTDLHRKFELGKKMFQIGKYDQAIALLQEAKGEVQNRAKVLHYLGLSFQKIGWNDEAIETLRQALTMLQTGDNATEMELKYALMEALLARGVEGSTMSDGEEAFKLASDIAIQNFNYKDIRAKRDEIKALIAKLKAP